MYSFSLRYILTLILLPAVLFGLPGTGVAQSISTVVGTPGSPGNSGDGGSSLNAKLQLPYDVVADAAGNLYIADYTSRVVRKVDAGTGIISTVAGNGLAGITGDGGPATEAYLNYPTNVAVDAAGNIYIADTYNSVVRKVDGNTGIITRVAGGGSNSSVTYSGAGTGAALGYVNYVALDRSGNLYFTDFQTIRKMDASGNLTTIAGNGSSSANYDYSGPATAAGINAYGITIDASGNIYLTDITTNTIRKIDVSGNMSNYAGNGYAGYGGDNGPATDPGVSLNGPNGLTTDAAGNVYFADSYNKIIRKVGSLPPAQTITFPDITTYYGLPDFVPTASASSGGALTFTIADFSVGRVLGGNTVHLLKPGTTTITATQSGSFSWQSATATASSGLPVSYSIADASIATITNGVVHLLKGGVTAITASQPGDSGSWSPAAPVTVTLSVTEVIAFSDVEKSYGDADFSLSATPAGGGAVYYQLGDPSLASIVNGSTLHILKAGIATISVGVVGVTGVPVTKTLTINKAPLTVTADDLQKQQGQDNPPLTVHYSGFVYGENNTALLEQPTVTTTAVNISPVGSYPITPASALADNYAISYKPGTMTVGPAVGEVTVNQLNAVFAGGMLDARVSAVKATDALLQLVDVGGHVLLSQKVSLAAGGNTYELPVSNIARGAYIVTVRGNGLKLIDKIIY